MKTLKKLVKEVGQEKAGELLGVSQGMVNNVLKGRKRFKAERCIDIEQRTKGTEYPITRHELRPDLFGKVAA